LILKKENIPYQAEAVNMILSLADGGVRDALSILDQVIAYTGGAFQEQDVLQLFGLISMEEKIAFLLAIGQQDHGAIVQKLDQYVARGADIKRLLSDLLIIFKDLLILVRTQNPALMDRLNETQANQLLSVWQVTYIETVVDALLSLQSDARYTQHLPTLLQLRLLQLKKPEESPNKKPTIFDVMKSPPLASASSTMPSVQIAETGDTLFIDDVNMIKVMVAGDKDQKNQVIDAWKKLDAMMLQPQIAPFAALLKDTRPYVLSKFILILETDQASVATKLNVVSNQKAIQSIIQNMSGYQGLIYTVNRQEAAKLKKLFMDLAQLNKLPIKQETPPTVKHWTFQ
jgi:DNA polymerase III gamma/tau subunit